MHSPTGIHGSGNADGGLADPASESVDAAMTSEAQRAANQQNARRSTGPRTAAGKARSSNNAIKHGAYCDRVDVISLTMLAEDPLEVAAFVDAIVHELVPTSVLEQAAARSVAQRMVCQVRANRFAAALIAGSVVDDEPLTPGTARFKVYFAEILNLAAGDAFGEPTGNPEAVARIIHSQMTESGLLMIFPSNDIAARTPETPEEWRIVLAKLLRTEYGGPEGAERAAENLIERFGKVARNAEARRVAAEASRALAYFRDVTDLQDRVDRMVARALRDYYALKARNAGSSDKLSLDGTIAYDVHEHETDRDETEHYGNEHEADDDEAEEDGPPARTLDLVL